MALPLSKLGRLALKSISKSRIQKGDDRRPKFSTLIPQSNHDRITTTMQRGYATGVDIGQGQAGFSTAGRIRFILRIGLGYLLIDGAYKWGMVRGRWEEAEAMRELVSNVRYRMKEKEVRELMKKL